MANFNYLSKDKVENDSIKNKSTYLLEGVKFVVQIVKKPVNNKICSERGFLCLNKHGGVMSAGEYFYQGSPKLRLLLSIMFLFAMNVLVLILRMTLIE